MTAGAAGLMTQKGQLRAMSSAAAFVADQLPPETADRMLQIASVRAGSLTWLACGLRMRAQRIGDCGTAGRGAWFAR